MTCPKCGLVQLSAPTCKACGTATGRPAFTVSRPGAAPTHVPQFRRAPPAARSNGPSAAQALPPSAECDDTPHGFTFHGTGRSLVGIYLVNIALIILTLGSYRFWASVRVRRYLRSQTEFEGDRFAYHATGKELWRGFTRAFALFWLPLVAVNVAAEYFLGDGGSIIVAGLTLLAILIVTPAAMVGTRRYRLGRTSWRSIRFSFRGSTPEFVSLFLKGMALSVLTLGVYLPVFMVRQYRFMTEHSCFGTVKAEFDGEDRGLVGSFLLAVLLTPFTLGLSWFWFAAKTKRFLWAHTTIGNARFRYDVTGGGLLGLQAVNLLLLVITLGLGRAWVVVRSVRFTLRSLTLRGALDLDTVQQDVTGAAATGEALAGLLDADLGFAPQQAASRSRERG
jgi:uncharacterized membrane protein YjgN (DUF898 family)